ncbi:MAG: hypothetical protein PHX54_09870 [Lentimicrobiaceae bacterium]|nr:hypothetical protein [Lentimicrobiaceae bacterium]
MAKQDKWDHKFAYFWFDEPHIFEWNQNDFDIAMKNYADTGINHIIDFSITHVRWSFHPWWDIINKTIEKLVKACHKHNIYLTEHHSAVILFCPDTPQRVEFMEKRFFAKRKGSYKHWPGFIENCLNGIEVDGKNLKEMFQIDPITNKPFIVDEWVTNRICTNHPDFIPLYLAYLENLYKLGIDGIMTDDLEMAYHPNVNERIDVPHCCACEFCREKYKEYSGYTLPPCGEEWNVWREKRDRPDYIAWLKFRKESIRKFHVEVKKHYESLKLSLFRPNYSATTIYWTNPGGYCFDFLPALDWVMIENTFEHIKRYSWPEWVIEHNHRFALARCREIPAAAMFYPHRKDEVEFCWALALNSGIGYLGTANCEPIDLNPWEKPLREFEKAHRSSNKNVKKIARTGFFFSRLTRDLYPEYEGRTRENLTTWMLACELENVPYDLLLPEELERLRDFNTIVLNEAAVMPDEQLERFKDFVKNGGKIIWVGQNAKIDESFRMTRMFEDIWGFKASGDWQKYGNGFVKALELEQWTGPLRRRVLAPLRMIKNDEPNYDYKAPTEEELELHRKIATCITESLADGPDLIVENAPAGLLFHCFADVSAEQLAVHALNAAGTLDKPRKDYVMDCDPIPFPEMAQAVTIKVRKVKTGKYSNATLLQPHTSC